MKTSKICACCKKRQGTIANSKYVRKNGTIHYTLYCRECNTDRSRRYRNTPQGILATNRAVYKSIKKYPERQAARIILNVEVNKGNVIKPKKCSKCGTRCKPEAHHHDYTKPLEVTWLCRSCHSDLK